MKIPFSFVLVTLGCILLISSCKKYEDGPFISLRSKTARVINTWVIESATRNNGAITAEYEAYTLFLEKDNKANLQYKIDDFGLDLILSTRGTWALEESKENLRLNFDNDDFDRYYQILRLKENELWLREIGYNGDELHLIPQ